MASRVLHESCQLYLRGITKPLIRRRPHLGRRVRHAANNGHCETTVSHAVDRRLNNVGLERASNVGLERAISR
jgi:hypothetical protein